LGRRTFPTKPDPRQSHHPGEGRGPVGEVVVTADGASLPPSPNWAPAFAGVVLIFWLSGHAYPSVPDPDSTPSHTQ
jgi:hypothetical protein